MTLDGILLCLKLGIKDEKSLGSNDGIILDIADGLEDDRSLDGETLEKVSKEGGRLDT